MTTDKEQITTLIIDDEKPAREIIRRMLEAYPTVTILAECEDGFEGARAIINHKPDLVFLDVQMPRVNGFEMLELLEEKPVIIFSTAYQEYALQAFEVSAADFLLKPYDKTRFSQAVDKAMEMIRQGQKQASLTTLNDFLNKTTETLTRIVVKKRNGIFVIPVQQIRYLTAQDDYVEIITPDGTFLKKQTLGFYENRLGDRFIRVHRSHLINIAEIHNIEPYSKHSFRLILHDGTALPVSRSGMQTLKKTLNL
jgi:two-component system, LytTR family, response regulator